MDTCARCGAEVRPMITEGGQLRDLDPVPTDQGNHVIITTNTGSIRARVLSGTSGGSEGRPTFRVHNCPPPPAPGPTCVFCLLPMHRELAALLKWMTHPSCDPEMQDEIARVRHLATARARRRKR